MRYETCPMCGKKLTNSNSPSQIIGGKLSKFTQSWCVSEFDHQFEILWDENSYQIDLMQINWDNCRSVKLNYVNNISNIFCWKKNTAYSIIVPRVLEPDFPNLKSFKEKVDLIILYS